MVREKHTPRHVHHESEEHFIEKGRRWPIIKILTMLVAVVAVFGAGMAVGRGDLHLFGSKSIHVNTSLSNQLDYSSVNQLYKILKTDFDGTLDQKKLIDGLKTGMVNAAGDPYTEYFSPKEAKDFNEQLSGSITGIGAELGTDDKNNIVVISPLEGYPAEKAGLKPHDIIAAINGNTTQGMSVSIAVSKIRGNPGTQVTLTLVRGTAKPFDVTITREKITVPSVKYEVNGNIGYLKITQFTADTVSLAQKAAKEFKSKNVKGIVLDLRGDPGGYLDASVGASSLWLDDGQTVVQERRGNNVVGTEYANGDNILKGIPTVVLIDNGSASASEIMAGALHDNGVATLVGTKSFGKGSVQQVETLADGAELKVTIARWYTPKGKNIDKQGITPDQIVTISDQDIAAGKDPQKDKAMSLVTSQIH
ncbi:S41 family peptidase [Candidatus Saccharibacteria bacterium]|nr:S41 family peptidase [Candidatus Saccharibacteria bacterium]